MKVAIYGANGWTGSLLAATLDRRGHQVILAGRNADKLEGLRRRLSSGATIAVADARDERALEKIFHGLDVVIPCAGPYRGLGETMLETAIACGCHYFDVSGEYEFVRDVYARYAEPARRNHLTLCTGFAVKGVLGDWCASVAAGKDPAPIEEVAVAYAHAFREYLFASPGSMISAASQGLFNAHDRYDPKRSIARRFEYPAPFGSGTALLVPMTDEVTIPRHISTPIARNYVAVAPGTPLNDLWATFFTSQLQAMPMLASTILSNSDAFKTLGETRSITPTERTFAAIAEVTRGGRRDGIGITLDDGYQATADIIAYALEGLASAPRGAVTPSELCDPRTALRELSRRHNWSGHRWSERR